MSIFTRVGNASCGLTRRHTNAVPLVPGGLIAARTLCVDNVVPFSPGLAELASCHCERDLLSKAKRNICHHVHFPAHEGCQPEGQQICYHERKRPEIERKCSKLLLSVLHLTGFADTASSICVPSSRSILTLMQTVCLSCCWAWCIQTKSMGKTSRESNETETSLTVSCLGFI